MAKYYKKDDVLNMLRERAFNLKHHPETRADYNESFAVERVLKFVEANVKVVDAEPVLHAHIIKNGNPICGRCSSCGESVNLKWKRCPICEAKFDLEDE